VLDATGVGIEWDVRPAGMTALETHGDLLPEETLDSIRRNKVGLKGPMTTPIGTGFRSVNVGLRHALGLYANLRPGKTIEGVQSTFDVHRPGGWGWENMEDHLRRGRVRHGLGPEARQVIEGINAVSGGQGRSPPTPPSVIKMITPEGSRRIVRYAFEYARANGRPLVTAVHKANIMKFTDGLFLREAQAVAAEYPEIEFNDRIVDNMCMQLMQKPRDYDVLVMPNLYGDIVSDLVAGMVGGLGVAPSGNIGPDAAVFEPIHGSAPSHAGKNEANPTAMILSGALMLRHLGRAGRGREGRAGGCRGDPRRTGGHLRPAPRPRPEQGPPRRPRWPRRSSLASRSTVAPGPKSGITAGPASSIHFAGSGRRSIARPETGLSRLARPSSAPTRAASSALRPHHRPRPPRRRGRPIPRNRTPQGQSTLPDRPPRCENPRVRPRAGLACGRRPVLSSSANRSTRSW
jgi:isocitrate dehydrogenase (NAD+)